MLMEVKRDDWFRAAMADETVVVELLLRLKHQYSHHASSSQMKSQTAMFLRWGIRQPRSRSLPINIRCHGGAGTVKREKRTVSGEFSNTTTRFSPTTPLSWSGGAGSSSPLATTTADGGFEESSRPSSPPAASRSKGTITTNEITSDAKNKRLKRKKTFSELKEEESFLMKERVQLAERIATTRETVKEQGVRNGNLKRLKHDLALHSGFVLPDLNMTPSEDDSRADTLYGTS